jgi:hypothetical protein
LRGDHLAPHLMSTRLSPARIAEPRPAVMPHACHKTGSVTINTGHSCPRPTAGQCLDQGGIRVFPSSQSNTSASGRPRLRDGFARQVWIVVGHQGAGIPSRRRRRRSRPGTGVHVVQPPGAPHGPPTGVIGVQVRGSIPHLSCDFLSHRLSASRAVRRPPVPPLCPSRDHLVRGEVRLAGGGNLGVDYPTLTRSGRVQCSARCR